MKPVIAALSLLALLLAGCGEPSRAQLDLPPEGDPMKKRRTEARGYTFKAPVAMTAQKDAVWVKSILARYDPKLDNGLPAEIIDLGIESGCRLPPARRGSETVVVNLYGGGMAMPVYRTTQKVLATNAGKIIDNARTARKDKPLYGLMGNGKIATDPVPVKTVSVTRTDKPVHLVLVSRQEGVWNLQVADGARVTGISLIGPDGTGYMNAPPRTPVTALAGAALRTCGIDPARHPSNEWDFVRKAHGGQELVEKYRRRGIDFENWLRRFYPRYTLYSAQEASHILIGPVPQTLEARIPYKPVTGATIHISTDVPVTAMPYDAYVLKLEEESTALAEQLAGMSISELRKMR